MEIEFSFSSLSDYENFLFRFKFRNYNNRLLFFDYEEIEYFFIPKYELSFDGKLLIERLEGTFERDYKRLMNDISSAFLGKMHDICSKDIPLKLKIYKQYNGGAKHVTGNVTEIQELNGRK